MHRKTSATLSAALILAASSLAQAALIDTFSDGTIVNTSAPPSQLVDQSGLSGVIGSGDRDVSWSRVSGPGTADLDLNNLVAGNALLSSSAATIGDWVLEYGFDTPFDVDLTVPPVSNAFVILFAAADVGTLTITAYDTEGDNDTKSVGIPSLPGGGSVPMLFSLFSPTVNFDHIAKLRIEVLGVAGGDYEMQILNTQFVPEPASVITFGLALVGLGGYCIRRRNRTA